MTLTEKRVLRVDELLKNLISQLSESPTVLSEATTRKIHRLIPVPTDYKIIWADISSFGGYPAGVVITDRALVTKATRNEVKAQKAQIKEKNKTDGKKQKPPKFIYRMRKSTGRKKPGKPKSIGAQSRP